MAFTQKTRSDLSTWLAPAEQKSKLSKALGEQGRKKRVRGHLTWRLQLVSCNAMKFASTKVEALIFYTR